MIQLKSVIGSKAVFIMCGSRNTVIGIWEIV